MSWCLMTSPVSEPETGSLDSRRVLLVTQIPSASAPLTAGSELQSKVAALQQQYTSLGDQLESEQDRIKEVECSQHPTPVIDIDDTLRP